MLTPEAFSTLGRCSWKLKDSWKCKNHMNTMTAKHRLRIMGDGPLRHHLLRVAYAELTRSLRGAYANLRYQTCKKKWPQIQFIVDLGLNDREKSIVLALGSQKRLLSPRSGWGIAVIMRERGSSDSMIQSGMIMAYATLRNPGFCLRDQVIWHNSSWRS